MANEKVFIGIDNDRIELTGEALLAFNAEREQWAAALAEEEAAKAALEAKKQEVLAKLGLTADEVAALLA